MAFYDNDNHLWMAEQVYDELILCFAMRTIVGERFGLPDSEIDEEDIEGIARHLGQLLMEHGAAYRPVLDS